MASVTFDGPNRLITVDAEITASSTITVAGDLYSRWKDWVKAGNAEYAPAFALSVGGNVLDPTTNLDAYIFLRNDLGWRIRPDERSHQLVAEGNLFGADVLEPVFVPTIGAFTVDIRLVLSSRALVRTTGTSGLTVAESAALIQAAADAAAARIAQEHFAKMADGARYADETDGTIKVIIPGGDPLDPNDIYRWAEAYKDRFTERYDGTDIKAQAEFKLPPVTP